MKDEIFKPAFGNRPRDLVGREEIVSKFKEYLGTSPGSRERATLMLGQRGTGKTVLLLEFAEIAKKEGVIVASPTIVTTGMLERILEKISKSGADFLPKAKTKVAGGNVSALGFGAGIQLHGEQATKRSFAWQLGELCEALNKRGKSLLILIDEVRSSHEELRQLIATYQELVGEGRDVSMVIAGTPMAISGVLNDHVLTFLNRANKLELPPLRKNDINAYYTKIFQEIDIRLDSKQIDLAAVEAEGSPYMMQLIGHYITVYADAGAPFGDDILRQAIASAKEDYINDICKTTLGPLSEKDIEFLLAMGSGDEVTVADITARLKCTDSYTQTYKRRLIQAGIIEQPRRGVVKYAVPYLKEYLAKLNA